MLLYTLLLAESRKLTVEMMVYAAQDRGLIVRTQRRLTSFEEWVSASICGAYKIFTGFNLWVKFSLVVLETHSINVIITKGLKPRSGSESGLRAVI